METLDPPDTSAAPYDKEMKEETGQLTSPTWELELFLSGAFVFAMLQLPGLIEQLFTALEPHATETASYVLLMGVLYGKAIAFTLVAMFLVHLVARAYWVALLGLQSVFPRGIRWSELKIGPIGRDVYQKSIPGISHTIARLDNFCSIIFSVGLLIVFMFVYSTMLGATIGGLSYALALVFTHGANMRYFFFSLMAIVVLIPLSASIIDKRRGDKLVPGSTAHRVVHGMLRYAFAINALRATGPMVWTLITNVGRAKSMVFLYVALFALLLASVADRLAQSDRLSINSYDFFAASRAHAVDNRFYESQRDGKPYPRVPSIQSDIIKDPYVKLFVPYLPRRDNPAIARACPKLEPLADRGLQIGADAPAADSLVEPVLSCIARMHAVTLDGTARPDVEFAFYEHPATGIKGVIAYIPVDSLPRGRHVLGVVPTPPTPLPKDTAALAALKRPTLIPFWK